VDNGQRYTWNSANADTYEATSNASFAFSEQTDASGIVTVATDTFTLGAGTYDITLMMRGMFQTTTGSSSPGAISWRLWNTTDSTAVDEFQTDGEFNLVFNAGSGRSIAMEPVILSNIIVLAGTKTFRMQSKRVDANWKISGASTSGNPVRVKIIKLA
jgi:hypothetical protein